MLPDLEGAELGVPIGIDLDLVGEQLLGQPPSLRAVDLALG